MPRICGRGVSSNYTILQNFGDSLVNYISSINNFLVVKFLMCCLPRVCSLVSVITFHFVSHRLFKRVHTHIYTHDSKCTEI